MVRKRRSTPSENFREEFDYFSLLEQMRYAHSGRRFPCPCCSASPCNLLGLVTNVLMTAGTTNWNAFAMRSTYTGLKFEVERHLTWANAEGRAVKARGKDSHPLERSKSDGEEA